MVYYILQKNKYRSIEKLIEQGDKAIKDPNHNLDSLVETQGTT